MKKNIIILFVVGLVLVITSFVFANLSNHALEREMDLLTNFDKVMGPDTKSYLYVDDVTYDTDLYSIVYVGDALYVVRFNGLDTSNITNKNIRIVGLSKALETSQKEALLKMHNGEGEEPDSQITIDDVEEVYGKYFLDVEKIVNDLDAGNTYDLIREIFLNVGLALMIFGAFKLIIYIKSGH